MKKILSLVLLVVMATIFSCSDESLDPLKTEEVKKGTILALRGAQLDSIYFIGVPGAEFYPRVLSGEETFDFDAEYLADDPNTLESFDIYAIKKTRLLSGDIETERVHLMNVPFSQFKETEDYMRPWVSVSIKLTDIFAAIGITDYTDPDVVDMLLSLYQPGINLESDLNLTDGTMIPAAEILASGLFDSDQFYPAQKLTYNSVEFCPFDIDSWDGATFRALEIYPNGSVSNFYDVTLEASGDRLIVHNFGNGGADVTLDFTPATTTPHDQGIFLLAQSVKGKASFGSGSYVQCDMSFTVDVKDATTKKVTATYQFEML